MGSLSHNRALSRARLPLAAALLVLLCGLALSVGRAGAVEAEEAPLDPNAEPPSFVVLQTDDSTLDELYATFRAYPGAPELRAMPNTLDLLAKRGETFNRYYVSYPLCCPSRVSLMTGRYAHNDGVKGNVQPNGGYSGFSFRGAYDHNIATWLQGAGYRTIHIGKFLNGYGDEPYSDGKNVPPGWSSWHTVLNADTHHYFYGYVLNNDGVDQRTVRQLGHLGTARIHRTRPARLPVRAARKGGPASTRPTSSTGWRAKKSGRPPPNSPSTCSSTTPSPHGDFRRPAGPEPAPRHYNWFKGAPLPHNRAEGFDEGNVSDKPSFIREAEHLTPSIKHTYKVYYDKQLEALRSIDDGVKQIVGTLAETGRLKNTYILFTSDNGFFFGEHRLIGGKFLSYEPATHLPFIIRGPGIKPGTRNRRAGRQHRHRADRPRPGGSRTRQERRRPLDGALPERPGSAHAPADHLRVLRADQRRRSQRRDRLDRRRGRRRARAATAAPTRSRWSPRPASRARRARRAARRTPRSSRRRSTTRESASARTSTSPGPTARRSSTTSTRTPTSSTTSSRSRTSTRSATSSTASCGATRTASAANAANRRRRSR